jgi:acyl-CoA thioester hydrolase
VSGAFEHQVDIRWRDVDALGHVNHAVFLTYLEEGRDRFYAEFVGDLAYVVARIELDLRAEVRLTDGRVTVRIDAEKLGRTSLTTRERIVTAGGVAAVARVVTVRWDADARCSVPFTAAEREQVGALLGDAT